MSVFTKKTLSCLLTIFNFLVFAFFVNEDTYLLYFLLIFLIFECW